MLYHGFVHSLPLEIVEQIFSDLVASYDDDPAYQWNQLRWLSPYQKSHIERHFRNFWLPKLSITLQLGSWDQIDYGFGGWVKASTEGGREISPTAVFRLHELPGYPYHPTPEAVDRAWSTYGVDNRVAHLRLGVGLLNKGFSGAYILHDTHLPGLEVSTGGVVIKFRWGEALDDIFREEMLLRRVTPRIVSEKTRFGLPLASLSLKDQLKILVLDVQKARRQAVLKKRATSHFSKPQGPAPAPAEKQGSRHLNASSPLSGKTDAAVSENNSRESITQDQFPDIISVAQQEESMIPLLPIFSDWLADNTTVASDDTMLELMAEERVWRRCSLFPEFRDDAVWQQEEREMFRGSILQRTTEDWGKKAWSVKSIF